MCYLSFPEVLNVNWAFVFVIAQHVCVYLQMSEVGRRQLLVQHHFK